MGPLMLDVRYSLRMMAKTPALTAILALTLALGIGVSTTIFSVVNSVVLRDLPYDHTDRLARLFTALPNANEDSPQKWVPGAQIVGDPSVVVINYGVWKDVFSGDPGVIGRKVFLDAI